MGSILVHRLVPAVLLALPAAIDAQDPKPVTPSLRQLLKDDAADFWVYDDLERGRAMARTSGKPLLVSFRCVP